MADKGEKGKRKKKNKATSRKYSKYKIEGNTIKRTASFCPRCGPGIFLAKSKQGDRVYCGSCHYTEFTKK